MDLSKSLYIFILKIKFTNHGFLNSNKPSNEKLISSMISIYIIMFDGRKQTKFLKLCLLQSFFFFVVQLQNTELIIALYHFKLPLNVINARNNKTPSLHNNKNNHGSWTELQTVSIKLNIDNITIYILYLRLAR